MLSRISTACFLVRLFFSATAAAICDLESAFAITVLVCCSTVWFNFKSFDSPCIKAISRRGARGKTQIIRDFYSGFLGQPFRNPNAPSAITMQCKNTLTTDGHGWTRMETDGKHFRGPKRGSPITESFRVRI